MRQRVLALLGVMASIAVVVLAMSVAGQTPTSAQQGPAAKTAWNEPDLQGIWGIDFQIPLQRPEKYKNKEFFTDAELAELDKERAAKPFGFGDKRAERGTERDLAGAASAQAGDRAAVAGVDLRGRGEQLAVRAVQRPAGEGVDRRGVVQAGGVGHAAH